MRIAIGRPTPGPQAGPTVNRRGQARQDPETPAPDHAEVALRSRHLLLLILNCVYEVMLDVVRPRFQWVREPTLSQLTQLTHTMSHRLGRLLEFEGLLERDTDDPMPDLVGHSVTYRIAVGPHRGHKECHQFKRLHYCCSTPCTTTAGMSVWPTHPATWPVFRFTPGRQSKPVSATMGYDRAASGETRPAVGRRGDRTQLWKLWNALRYRWKSANGAVLLPIPDLH